MHMNQRIRYLTCMLMGNVILWAPTHMCNYMWDYALCLSHRNGYAPVEVVLNVNFEYEMPPPQLPYSCSDYFLLSWWGQLGQLLKGGGFPGSTKSVGMSLWRLHPDSYFLVCSIMRSLCHAFLPSGNFFTHPHWDALRHSETVSQDKPLFLCFSQVVWP